MRPSKTIPGWSIILTLLFYAAGLQAQEPSSVHAKIDATSITVGDQIRMFIEARHDNGGGTMIWPQIPDTFNSLEIVERNPIDTTVNGTVSVYKQRLLITGFDSGMFQIPSFRFQVVPNQGDPYALLSDSFFVSVTTVPVDTSKPFEPIKEIKEVKTTWRDYIWYIIGGLILLALTGFVIWYFRKHKKVAIPQFIPKAPAETPQEKAMRRLQDLEQQQLWQQERVKEYYSGLTDILRMYIEELYRIPAMEYTSDELLDAAAAHPQMHPHVERLRTILRTADMAKFAKAKPLPQEHTACLEATKFFVQQTMAVSPSTDQQA